MSKLEFMPGLKKRLGKDKEATAPSKKLAKITTKEIEEMVEEARQLVLRMKARDRAIKAIKEEGRQIALRLKRHNAKSGGSNG